MEFSVEKWEDLRIVYVRRTGAYGPENKQTMERLKSWARERGLLVENAVLLGIPRDDPRETPAADCRYDACLVTDRSPESGETREVRAGMFEGGDYAVFRFAHTAEGMQEAWNRAFPALLAGGYRPQPEPAVERYAEPLLRVGLCELCVPVSRIGTESET